MLSTALFTFEQVKEKTLPKIYVYKHITPKHNAEAG
jgi:hypothetical protein